MYIFYLFFARKVVLFKKKLYLCGAFDAPLRICVGEKISGERMSGASERKILNENNNDMKKQFFVLTMVLLGLFAGVGTMKANIISDIVSQLESMTAEDYYYVQMVATPSPASSGTVQLMWIDMMGDTINANDFSEDDPEKAQYAYMYNVLNPGVSGYPNPTGYGANPRLTGTTVLYGEMEAPLGNNTTHVYVSSFAYFKAEAQPADGWYFDSWSYNDNGQILKLDTLRNGENVLWPTDPRDPNEHNATVFKVKPHNQKGTKYLDPSQVSSAAYDSVFRYVQANFKPVLLTGYYGGKSEIVVGESDVIFDVYVTIEAKKEAITVADFETPTLANSTDFAIVGMEGGYDMETATPYAKLSVRFTAPGGITAGTFYKTTITASSKGGSTLVVPVEVRAVAADRTEATLYNADQSIAAEGNIADVLPSIAGTEQTLRLNKNYGSALSLSGKTVKLDMNGYTVSSLTVSSGKVTVAYSKYDEDESGALIVEGGEVILNGGIFSSLSISSEAKVEQNAATITGAVTNNGILIANEGAVNGGVTSKGTLTINGGTFKGETAILVTGGTATLNKGIIRGTAYGVRTTAGTTTIEKLAAIDGGTNAVAANGGKVTVNNGKFGQALAGSLTLKSGYFKNQNIGVAIPDGKNLMNVAAGAEYEEGYRYFVGNASDALASGVGVCRIGSASYARLEEAIAYANNHPSEEGIIILMTNDYILPAGYYTLPANATIVVPKDDSQENSNSVVSRTVKAYQKPSEFRRLTFAAGVKMEVFGAIEVSCMQHAYDTGNGGYNSNPWGPYGLIVLEEGAKLTLQDGSHIYAWGFITGKGEIDARRGSTVHEQFQMGDWKGGTTSFNMLSDSRGVFPVTQYWIQNVEAPAKFHPGSVLTASAAVSVLNGMVTAFANDINIIGVSSVSSHDQAMFLLDNEADAENTWIYKWYDVENDMQVYDVNNTAHIGSLVLNLGKLGSMDINMNSALFKLPITNNMKIHLLSGFMDFTQDTYLLPGALVEVDKKAVVAITKQEDPNVHSGSLYIYDADDWGDYIIDTDGVKKFTKAVLYEPLTDGRPAVRKEKKSEGQRDATVLVHGQFDTYDGYVYTSNGGANICSTDEDAGTFTFSIDAQAADYTEEVYHAKGTSIDDTPDIFGPAKLCNATGADPAYSSTGGMKADMSYCYMDGKWTQLAIDPDNANFMRDWYGDDNYGGFYAKPSEYVKVTATKDPSTHVISGNDDETFSDAAGTGRLFILLDMKPGYPQWWEVEKVGNLYHCIHPNNDTYYEYGDYMDYEGMPATGWHEKRYTVTWKNWDGTILQTMGADEVMHDEYSVTYGTEVEYLGTNPTREKDAYYTYSFAGWSPEPGRVVSDTTFTAVFTREDLQYTIIFQHEGGKLIESKPYKHNEFPVCENLPTKAGYTLQWSPAVAAVSGDAVYTATWLEVPPTEYEIKFVDYNGTTVLQRGNVAVDATPVAPIITDGIPTGSTGKPATSEYTYVFDHWTPEITPVKEAMTYMAVYSEQKKSFPVKFYFEQKDNEHLIAETNVEIGQVPVIPSDERLQRENDAANTYKLIWTPQIETVIGHDGEYTYEYVASYEATPNKYVVTLKSNNESVCTFKGAGMYTYGDGATIEITLNDPSYSFDGWKELGASDPNKTATSFTTTVNGDITLTAQVSYAGLENKDVAIGTPWDVPAGTNIQDFIIHSNGTNSSQVTNAQNLKVWGKAIYKLEQSMTARTWYAVAVPWKVNVRTGVYDLNGNRLRVASQFDMITFDANAYANGADGYGYWHYVDETGDIMVPGKLYMVYLAANQRGLQFHKMDNAPLQTTNISLALSAGSGPKANWNAIANPALYKANLSTGAEDVQIFNSADESYTLGNTSGMIVAAPAFVQVSVPGTVLAELVGGGSGMPAIRRAPQADANKDNRFVVELTSNGKLADRLIVQTAEEKEDKYVINQDLAKMGVSTKVAQMWMEQYDAKLCKHTEALITERAEYPLSLFAPKAGEYVLSAEQARGDAELYLTYNGEAIANLSNGAYTLVLSKGTTYEYGLRVSARSPQVATGCDEVIADGADKAQKIMVNGTIYIIRGSKVYTIDGQLVK